MQPDRAAGCLASSTEGVRRAGSAASRRCVPNLTKVATRSHQSSHPFGAAGLVRLRVSSYPTDSAICEAAQRPTMRFVAVKTEEQQARGMLFHTRDLLVRQRTQTINALRGHLAEFGVVAPQGPAHVDRLASALQDPGAGLPGSVRELGALLFDRIEDLDAKIDGLRRELRARVSGRRGGTAHDDPRHWADCQLRQKISHFCRSKISHFERSVVPPDAVFGVSDLVEL